MSTPVGAPRGAHSKGGPGAGSDGPAASLQLKLLGAWTFVGIPLAYGIIQTVRRATALFTG